MVADRESRESGTRRGRLGFVPYRTRAGERVPPRSDSSPAHAPVVGAMEMTSSARARVVWVASGVDVQGRHDRKRSVTVSLSARRGLGGRTRAMGTLVGRDAASAALRRPLDHAGRGEVGWS
jgi:hypothetical protein